VLVWLRDINRIYTGVGIWDAVRGLWIKLLEIFRILRLRRKEIPWDVNWY